MTSEVINGYLDYWKKQARYWEYEYYRTKSEEANDSYVKASDHIEICELAKCQLYANEERRRGLTTDERHF